jgi:hypothetical protein
MGKAGSRHKPFDALGRPRLTCQPSSRTGENPPYGMIGRTVETSASFEARYAPLSYPTAGGDQRWSVPTATVMRSVENRHLGCDDSRQLHLKPLKRLVQSCRCQAEKFENRPLGPPNTRLFPCIHIAGTIARCHEVLQIRVAGLSDKSACAGTPLGRANSPCTAVAGWAGEFAIPRGDHGAVRDLLVCQITNRRG